MALPNPRALELQDVVFEGLTWETIPSLGCGEPYNHTDEDGDTSKRVDCVGIPVDWARLGVSADDYEKLSLNRAEFERWIKEAGWRLLYYQGKLRLDHNRVKEDTSDRDDR